MSVAWLVSLGPCEGSAKGTNRRGELAFNPPMAALGKKMGNFARGHYSMLIFADGHYSILSLQETIYSMMKFNEIFMMFLEIVTDLQLWVQSAKYHDSLLISS
jgi:hypothetical protein